MRALCGLRTIFPFAALVVLLVTSGCSSSEPESQPTADAAAEMDSSTSGTEETGTDSKSQAESGPAAESTLVTDVPAEIPFVPPELSIEELRDGWISLFDGMTLFGWDVPSGANWRVEDGSIVADQGNVSLLTTPFRFGDFEFRCEFHLESSGNSGIFLRTADNPQSPASDTYELNVCDGHPEFPTGSLVGRKKADDVPPVEGNWHRFHVTCREKRIVAQLDGKTVLDFTDQTEQFRAAGTIGLQFNQGRIAFRDIHLRPLGQQKLFNGEDLSGWHQVPGGSSRFDVTDGVLKIEDGPGFLETDKTFGDFILHVESNIHDEKAIADNRPANSGVFFRTIRGTEDAPSHGYEMQIQHDYRDENRATPLDFGAGAIYRRKAARYIVANNNEWVVQTLIAQGNRFATFVNGYPVLLWQDDRQPDPNPRRGLRLEPGHISLQGHDPTTDIEFRSLRIHSLPPATSSLGSAND